MRCDSTSSKWRETMMMCDGLLRILPCCAITQLIFIYSSAPGMLLDESLLRNLKSNIVSRRRRGEREIDAEVNKTGDNPIIPSLRLARFCFYSSCCCCCCCLSSSLVWCSIDKEEQSRIEREDVKSLCVSQLLILSILLSSLSISSIFFSYLFVAVLLQSDSNETVTQKNETTSRVNCIRL